MEVEGGTFNIGGSPAVVVDDRHPVAGVQQLAALHHIRPVGIHHHQQSARLGVEERMRDRSIYVQVFLAFFLPLALAVVHAAVGMTSANAAIAQVGRVDSAASSAVTAAFILVVYGAYFLATCWGSRRIIRGR